MKLLNIIRFLAIFDPNQEKNLALTSLIFAFLAIIAINFQSGGFTTTASKNYYFSAQLMQKWGSHGPHPPKKLFFSEITFLLTKPDPKLSKPFYFNKISYALAEL